MLIHKFDKTAKRLQKIYKYCIKEVIRVITGEMFVNYKIKICAYLSVLAFAFITIIPVAKASSVNYATPKVSFVFDDGLDSTFTLAAPTLAKYGFAGSVGIVTGCVGMVTIPNTCQADEEYAYMTWDKVSQMSATYNWEIASHSVTHPMLATSSPVLTEAQVVYELSQSQADLQAHGFNATSFITPYGDYEPDGHPVVASLAKYYQSMRGFQDTGYNVFPYSDYLLRDQIVHATTSVATIKSYIDTAKANNQWLILTFHHIVASNPSTDEDDYEYNNADLDQIAAYAKSLGISVVTMKDGLAANDANMLPNSSFDSAIGSNTTDTTVWSTDNPAGIKQDVNNNGNYPNTVNSVYLSATSANSHLLSPLVPIDPSKKYVLKNFLNITNISSGKVSFYIDEYDAQGVWVSGKNYFGQAAKSVASVNFEYIPSSVSVAKARLQVVVAANSGITGYVDNCQWFAQDGSTVTPAKTGDVNGDNSINALDLSIMLSNWNKTGAINTQGDLSGDTIVNALDLSILLTNWGK